jgi:hypothetical protein
VITYGVIVCSLLQEGGIGFSSARKTCEYIPSSSLIKKFPAHKSRCVILRFAGIARNLTIQQAQPMPSRLLSEANLKPLHNDMQIVTPYGRDTEKCG